MDNYKRITVILSLVFVLILSGCSADFRELNDFSIVLTGDKIGNYVDDMIIYNGELYAGGVDGVFKFDDKRFNQIYSLDDVGFVSSFQEHNGDLYIGSRTWKKVGGIYKLDKEGNLTHLITGGVDSFAVYGDSNFLISINGKLGRMEGDNYNVIAYQDQLIGENADVELEGVSIPIGLIMLQFDGIKLIAVNNSIYMRAPVGIFIFNSTNSTVSADNGVKYVNSTFGTNEMGEYNGEIYVESSSKLHKLYPNGTLVPINYSGVRDWGLYINAIDSSEGKLYIAFDERVSKKDIYKVKKNMLYIISGEEVVEKMRLPDDDVIFTVDEAISYKGKLFVRTSHGVYMHTPGTSIKCRNSPDSCSIDLKHSKVIPSYR